MTSNPTQSVSTATVDIGKIFVEGGFMGLVIYAIILAFFLLLVRDFLKDWMIRSVAKEQTAANLEVAKGLASIASEMRAITFQLSQMQSVFGYHDWLRAKAKGELPPLLPEAEKP